MFDEDQRINTTKDIKNDDFAGKYQMEEADKQLPQTKTKKHSRNGVGSVASEFQRRRLMSTMQTYTDDYRDERLSRDVRSV